MSGKGEESENKIKKKLRIATMRDLEEDARKKARKRGEVTKEEKLRLKNSEKLRNGSQRVKTKEAKEEGGEIKVGEPENHMKRERKRKTGNWSSRNKPKKSVKRCQKCTKSTRRSTRKVPHNPGARIGERGGDHRENL